MKKKLLFLSGSRADFDLIFPIYKFISDTKKIDTGLILTGTNLDKKYSNKKKIFSNKSIFKIRVNLHSSNSKNFLKLLVNTFINSMKFYIKKNQMLL